MANYLVRFNFWKFYFHFFFKNFTTCGVVCPISNPENCFLGIINPFKFTWKIFPIYLCKFVLVKSINANIHIIKLKFTHKRNTLIRRCDHGFSKKSQG